MTHDWNDWRPRWWRFWIRVEPALLEAEKIATPASVWASNNCPLTRAGAVGCAQRPP
jgi:hypothetical protein